MSTMPPPPTSAAAPSPPAASNAEAPSLPVSSTAPTPLSTPALREAAAELPAPMQPVAPQTDDGLLDLDDFDLGGESTTSIDLNETQPEPHIERATDIELGLPDDGTSSPTFTERAADIPNLAGLEN